MNLYAPTYYKNFRCIADKCEHSCCVGWEIDIDPITLEKYQSLSVDYASAIRESISMEDTPHFKLCEHDRCPHLDEHGLCKIITNCGEDDLCDICREHPRFYNYTSVAEVGLGMSCPEAARIILSSPDFATLEKIGSVDAVSDDVLFDGRAERQALYAILEEIEDYSTALTKLYETYSIDKKDDKHWTELLDSLEYLDTDHKALFMKYSSTHRPNEADEVLKRFLAYLIYRHCTEAFDAEDFRDRLSFCLFCEQLFASLICTEQAKSLQEFATLASIISEEIEYSDENTFALIN